MSTKTTMTEDQEKAYGEQIASIFGLEPSKENPDRWHLRDGYGTKTALGLTRTLLEMARKIQNREQI